MIAAVKILMRLLMHPHCTVPLCTEATPPLRGQRTMSSTRWPGFCSRKVVSSNLTSSDQLISFPTHVDNCVLLCSGVLLIGTEIKFLQGAVTSPKRPFGAIVGGAKVRMTVH